MFKKFAFIACVLTLALVPFRPAAAWGEVCVEFPLWDSGYEGFFIVTHLRERRGGWGSAGMVVVSERASERIFPDEHRCVDISNIPPGDKFAVSVSPHFAPHLTALCAPEGEAWAAPWLDKPDSHSGAVWFVARGSEESPICEFARFER